MRITITLDDEVVAGIGIVQDKLPDIPFEDIVNQLIKKGLAAVDESAGIPFKIQPLKNLVPKPGLNFDNVQSLLSQVEGDDRKW